MTKPTVSILATGGTIAGKRDPITSAIKPVYTAEELLSLFPEIEQIATVKLEPPIMLKLSEDMTPEDWVTIANAIKKELTEDIDGIVVTHGTYTMGYTSAALSFMLRNIPVPIILTGAQVPITENESHVKSNIMNSLYVAGNSDLSGVNIVFAGDEDSSYSNIYNGTRARKCFSWKMNCFRSVSMPPIGKVKNNMIEYNIKDYPKINRDIQPIFETKLNKKVSLLKAYPGIQSDIIDQIINRGYKGIILEGYADGSFPTTKQFIDSLYRAKKEEVPVFATSQSLGKVTLSEYESGRKMLDAGVVPLGDMLFETALVKLMWILGHTKDVTEVKERMRFNYVGEIRNESWIK